VGRVGTSTLIYLGSERIHHEGTKNTKNSNKKNNNKKNNNKNNK
jgi:hypothetical protein